MGQLVRETVHAGRRPYIIWVEVRLLAERMVQPALCISSSIFCRYTNLLLTCVPAGFSMLETWRFIVALMLLPICAPGASAQVQPAVTPPPASADKPPDPRESMCLMIESAARANHLPLEFFARVISQESRFQADVIGPPTRSGERAQGIAQFMPRTAVERRLLDPFDPVQALPKSAEFLRELRDQFGNLGLAAAAYNAGPQRVRDWMKGARTLPDQTRHYVLAITGTSVDEWAKGAKGEPGQPGTPNCRQLMALLRRAPNPFVEKLQERINLVGVSPWGHPAERRILP